MRSLVVVLPLLVACAADPAPSQPSPPPLVSSRPEPAGANCAQGGVAIDAGLDDDGDGALSASEVISTSYVCSTSTTAQPLIRIIPAGASCPDGGSAIQVGLDMNNNHVLDDSEVTSTSVQCGGGLAPTTIMGDVEVRNSAEVAALEGVDHVTGSLSCVGGLMPAVTFATLKVVDGTIQCRAVDSIALPALEMVGLPRQVQWLSLDASNVELPRLSSAAIAANATSLVALSLPMLASGQLDLAGNMFLTSLSAPSLTDCPELDVSGNPGLPACQATALAARCHPLISNLAGNDDTATCP